jgi:hypothetical protein
MKFLGHAAQFAAVPRRYSEGGTLPEAIPVPGSAFSGSMACKFSFREANDRGHSRGFYWDDVTAKKSQRKNFVGMKLGGERKEKGMDKPTRKLEIAYTSKQRGP